MSSLTRPREGKKADISPFRPFGNCTYVSAVAADAADAPSASSAVGCTARHVCSERKNESLVFAVANSLSLAAAAAEVECLLVIDGHSLSAIIIINLSTSFS